VTSGKPKSVKIGLPPSGSKKLAEDTSEPKRIKVVKVRNKDIAA